ncbi:MAG: hypothetical protein L7F78_01915 [Syntrophales bacterium LBB04]|nr:hypothetical protein [Syntrophales bacterium LBB04]
MQNIFREFVFILFYRSRIVIIVFLTVFLISLFLAVSLPSVYRSAAKFSLVIPQSMDPLQQESSIDYQNRMRRFLQDQKELIMSDRVLKRVVLELYPSLPKAALAKQIDDISTNTNVVPPEGETFLGSSVFLVEFTDKNPEWARKVAASLAQNYQAAYLELSRSKTDYSLSFFTEQVEKLKQEMMNKESKVRDFEVKQALALLEILNLGEGKSNAEVGPNMLLTQFLGRYHDLQTELAGLQTSISSLEHEVAQKGIPAVLPDMEVSGRSITIFKSKVSQLQMQMNEMKPQFSENFQPMKQVEQEYNLSVESLKKELSRTITAQKINAQSIRARIGQLEKTINELRDRVQTIAQEKATYQGLLQEYNLAKGAYEKTSAQMEQARMANSVNQEKQYLTLIDNPALPIKPFKPNRILLAFGGLMSGIFLGIAVALTIDHFDHRMKTIYEIEKHLNIPVLGAIPSL